MQTSTGICLLAVLLMGYGPAKGQHWLGVASGNYAGTNALYQQPAQAADSRYRLYVNLAGFDSYVHTNYMRYAAPFSLLSLLTNTVPARYRNARGQLVFPYGYLPETLNGRPKRLFMGGEVRGPGVLINLAGGRMGLGLTSRVRVGMNARRVDEPTARFMRNGVPLEAILPATIYDNQSGAVNVNGYGELAATFGYVLQEEGEQFWKLGITAKRLIGLYNTHLIIDDASHQLVRDRGVPNMLALNIRSAEATYGYTTEGAFSRARLTPGWLLGRQSAGGGWGLDLGVVYEYRPEARRYRYTDRGEQRYDGSKNKYQYRVSVALTDIGAIQYRNPAYVNRYDVNATNRRLTRYMFVGVSGLDGYLSTIDKTLGLTQDKRQTSFWSALPTALNVNVDYKVQENVYVNATWIQGVMPANSVGFYTPSVLAVTPRYETRWAEIAMPVSLQGNYTNLTFGLAARLGPVYMGTDHLPGLLSIGKPRGANLYAGAFIPLFRPGPKNPNECYEPGKWRLFRR
ncbi:hypothetical protein GCM10023187_02030 [Nibrella viscosa]|uniref:DUF5723 domain-containing protein n=1 Tax=Nibrella viscosa TaxID=1084524 RepID=A0ABP8JSC0_9BACT